MMMYALVILVSLIACVMGFVSEITVCNATHIKNGRKPEAGASIFPVIPIMQILLVLLAWGLNRLHPSLGFYAVGVLFIIFCLFWTPSFLKAKRELNQLKETGTSEQHAGQVSSEAAPSASPDEPSA